MSGWTDVPLTRTGLAEAYAAARWLSATGSLPIMYASPLRRALCTALVIARRCHTELRVDPDLKEIHCGEADGLPIREVMSRFPRHWEQNLAQDNPAFCWPGGETYADFRRRAVSAVARIAAAHEGERVVLVTHAGVITQILGWIEGCSPARWDQRRVRNGSITELLWRGGEAHLVRFDQLGEQLALAPTRGQRQQA
jgi:broad specificity phosphatase PhoE